MRIDKELAEVAEFWSTRYRTEGFIWGTAPSPCAYKAATCFMSQGVERVLELGCGYGRDAVYLANQGFDVTAVDFSAAALALANSWTMRGDGAGRLDYLRDNLVDLDLAESAYDAVFSHRTLHLVVSRERLNKAFAEIHRVLKPGGTACVSLRNPRDPTQAKTHGSGGEYSEVSFRPGHRILFLSDAELTEIVEPHFSIVAHEEVQERESRTQNYEAALHFLVLSKGTGNGGRFAE